MSFSIDAFVRANMLKGARLSPPRLRAALALLERLRQQPSLKLTDHIPATKFNRTQTLNYLAGRVARRLELNGLDRYCGQWSSKISTWGQQLLDGLDDAGFLKASEDSRSAIIDCAQSAFAAHLRCFYEREPLQIRIRCRSAEAVVESILGLARAKGKLREVARLLVDAVLRLQRGSRGHGAEAPPSRDLHGVEDVADFQIGDALLIVAIELPDEARLRKISTTLRLSTSEVWVLTRTNRVESWKTELRLARNIDPEKIVVRSVASFVGQNVSEIGRFSANGQRAALRRLFGVYNRRCVRRAGTPGLQIVINPSCRGGRRRAHRESSRARL